MARKETLDDWLAYIEALHPSVIDMGLERVARVRDVLQLVPRCPIITVGGTNGKGSTCALLEAVLVRAGYRVGCYTSPHLLQYNERVRINTVPAEDAQLCRAFAAIEAARGATSLTYFEFGTLAAVYLFCEQQLDVLVLEVGLGGRLDAVNAFDADCAIVTNVDLDHMAYLGDNVESIGREKAGIFRAQRPAIFADQALPASVREHAQRIGAQMLVLGSEFGYERRNNQWDYWGPQVHQYALPLPALRGAYQLNNASACLTALHLLRNQVPVALQHIKQGLLGVELTARFQVLPGQPLVILDVAHNVHAARALASNLQAMSGYKRTLAVFGMLKDKDIAGVIDAVHARIDVWFVAPIDAPRGAAADTLVQLLAQRGASHTACKNLEDAYMQARRAAQANDRIIVFGSFYTVAGALHARAIGGAG